MLSVWAPTEAKDPLLGSRLGEYEITARLGLGGMGIVYEGVQPLIGKRVAIKVLRWEVASDDEQMQRLLTEARSVNSIRHRGIIDIFSFGELPDGRHYFVMEYLDGTPLNRLVAREAPLPVKLTVSLLEDVLASLDAAHRAGVIHRDLKPSNVFVVQEPGGARYAKLLDFGLAKQGPIGGGITPQTQASMVVGTPGYMAPEQARGEPVGPQTDLYSLGVMAYEMLTGRLPYSGKTFFEVVEKQTRDPAPHPAALNPEVPPTLDDLVTRLMTATPAKRPRSAEDVLFEVKRIHRAASTEGLLVTTQQALEITQRDQEEGSTTAPMESSDRHAHSEGPETRSEKSAPRTRSGAGGVRWFLVAVLVVAAFAGAGVAAWRYLTAPQVPTDTAQP